MTLPRAVVAVLALTLATTLGACSSDPTLADLPADVARARPTISAEEARFVLTAKDLGVSVTGASVADDLETGTTTCWALQNAGVSLRQIAVDDAGKPLGNTGEALRTKLLMEAAVQSLCPDFSDQSDELALP